MNMRDRGALLFWEETLEGALPVGSDVWLHHDRLGVRSVSVGLRLGLTMLTKRARGQPSSLASPRSPNFQRYSSLSRPEISAASCSCSAASCSCSASSSCSSSGFPKLPCQAMLAVAGGKQDPR